MQDNYITLNHSSGIRVGFGMQVLGNVTTQNGQFGVGGGGFDRHGQLRAGHRYGGLRPRAGSVQQYCGAQTNPLRDQRRRNGPGLPDA